MNENTTPSINVTTENASNLQGIVPFFGNNGLQTRATADLSKDDFANIYVAKIENKIRARIRECTDNYHAAQTTCKAAEKAVEDFLVNLGRQAAADAKPVADTLTTWGVPCETRANTPDFNPRTNRVSFNVSVASTMSGYHNSQAISRSWSEDAPSALTDLYATYEANSKAVEAAQQTLAQARSALHNIASAERQAKAAVVSKVIADLDGGEDLLKQIDESMDTDDIVHNLSSI